MIGISLCPRLRASGPVLDTPEIVCCSGQNNSTDVVDVYARRVTVSATLFGEDLE
jgi:hypothetical protein